MANTYTQLYIHLVFAVKSREHLIPKKYKESVQKYITGVVQKRSHKMLSINCMPDHTHVFIGLNPDQSLSTLVQETKAAATKFIKKQDWMTFAFSWQRGFGAFSYSRSHIDTVVKYIQNQEEHHRKKTFKDEYIKMLENFEVSFEERYLFDFYIDN